MAINKNEITKEMLEKAMQCKTADELMALAKSEGVELTETEAEAYLAEIAAQQANDSVTYDDISVDNGRLIISNPSTRSL